METLDTPQVQRTLNIKLEDADTKNYVDLKVDFFNENSILGALTAIKDGLRTLGFITPIEEGVAMTTEEKIEEKTEEQKQDLTHQKPEETDNMQKSERPSDEYMKSHELDPDTHGKKKEE